MIKTDVLVQAVWTCKMFPAWRTEYTEIKLHEHDGESQMYTLFSAM